jgi:aspartate racemase
VNAPAFLLELLQEGVQLWVEDDELCYQAPQGALSPARREELSALKAEIVALLTQQKTKYSFPSFAQQRLWFLDQLEPGNPFYNMPAAIRLTGQLNVAALDQSLNEIVRRHQTLRTTFPTIEGLPLQVIAPAQPLTLPTVDLQASRKSEQEASVRWLAREEARRPFDLARGPLFRTKLLRLGEEEHVLLVGMHHIVSDGWSMGVFWRELRALYNAFCVGKPSPLAELPIQYADYAIWQRGWLQGEVLDKQLGYWKRQLADVAALELPTDRPRPPVQTYRGARQSLTLPKSLTEALRELSRREGVTLFMTLLAAFQTLLHRYTGQDDVVVGSPIAGRTQAETEGLIGLFANTLVMCGDLSGDPTFRELLGRVQEVALAAHAHQDLPFEKLVEELKPERDTSRSPLFQVAFVLQNPPRSPRQARKLAGLKLTQLEVGSETAKFDLTLSMIEGPAGLKGWVEYNTDLFDSSTIDRMLGHFRMLLKGVVANREQRLSELPLLTEAERHQVLVEWNDTQTDYLKDRCVHELFEEQAEKNPEAVAVVFDHQHLTYRELNTRANQLAYALRELGVGPEVPVGVCLERSPEMVVAVLGVLKAGGAYVPLDPTYPKERLEFMLEDTSAPVLLVQEATRHVLPEYAAAHTHCLGMDSAGIERAEAENPPSSGASPESLAYVIYTSGSTGKPKGVCVPHRAVGRLVMNADYAPLTSADVVAQASNCAFDAATWEIWGALLNGARLVVLPRDVTLSPRALAAEIERNEISALFLTTALFNQVARENPGAFRPLRHLLFGGEAVEPKWVRTVLAEGAPERLLHVYGPTETTTFATWHLVEAVEDRAATIPIGRPITSTEAYVLDAWERPVPVGVPGELYIGGPGVARGYLGRPELTEEKFIPHPFSDEPGVRLYKTGDRVRRRANGDIEFLGRSDGQVKLRGYRIELGEVESALNSNTAVRESVVMLHEDDTGQKRLAAYIVPAGVAPSHNELRAFLRERLPDYMTPSSFISLEVLPLTSTGKIDRHALPVPVATRPADSESYSDAPRDALEKRLAGILEEALGVPAVGVEDDFFELGGHSLLAANLFAQIEKAFGYRLPLSILFRAPTVRQLADILRRESEEVPRESVVAIQPRGSRPPFFCVAADSHTMLSFRVLAQYLGSDQPFYSFQAQDQNKERMVSLQVEGTAASYIRELREVQPEGPYFLGGLCFGGVIAFEMARQLCAQGQDVALVAILDMALPNCLKGSIRGRLYLYRRRLRRLGQLGYLRRKMRKGKRIVRKVAYLRVRKVVKRFTKRIVRIVRRVIYAVGTVRRVVFKSSLPFGYCLRRALRNTYLLEQWDRRLAKSKVYPAPQQIRQTANPKAYPTHWQMRQALNSYKAQPYSGQITLFPTVGLKSYYMFHNEPYLGWDRVAAGGVEVYKVAGKHQTLLKEPHVQVLATRLKTCLKQARTSSS